MGALAWYYKWDDEQLMIHQCHPGSLDQCHSVTQPIPPLSPSVAQPSMVYTTPPYPGAGAGEFSWSRVVIVCTYVVLVHTLFKLATTFADVLAGRRALRHKMKIVNRAMERIERPWEASEDSN